MNIQPKLAGCSIMVVEDEFYVAVDLKKTLEAFGAEVMGPFADVDDALVGLEKQQPACAILDVNLAGRSVYGLARPLRELQVPIAFYTGYDPAMMPNEFVNEARLEKPVDVELLRAVVGRLCQRTSARPGDGGE